MSDHYGFFHYGQEKNMFKFKSPIVLNLIFLLSKKKVRY